MKRTQQTKANKSATAEMLAEYRFDYRKARPNRFAGQADKDRVIVVLDPDVSAEFRTAEDVNDTLRAIADILRRRKKRAKRKTA